MGTPFPSVSRVHSMSTAAPSTVEKENAMAEIGAGETAGMDKVAGETAIVEKGGKGKKNEGESASGETGKAGGMSDSLKSALADKISNLQEKKNEDERVLTRMYKKASKELKEQLEALGENKDEKIKMLHTKLLEKIHECNKLDRNIASQQRAIENAQSDKESAVSELARVNNLKGKLETLCKELQKQNKLTQEEYRTTTETEQERRKEQSERFSATIKDVQEKMEVQDQERMKQATENDKLREQLQNFISQYEVREKHFEHQLHAKDLECQLAEAKLKQSEEMCKKVLENAEAYKARLEVVSKEELASRTQLATYGDKFKDFQETLTKSNDMFASFKKESDKMQKRLKVLEKERKDAVVRGDKFERLCIDSTESLEAARKELSGITKQKSKLETLCRTLTDERAKLKARLGEGAPPAEGDAAASE